MDTTRASVVFNLGARLDGLRAPDVCLRSADGIYFYVHSHVTLRDSANAFGGLYLLAGTGTSSVTANGGHETSHSLEFPAAFHSFDDYPSVFNPGEYNAEVNGVNADMDHTIDHSRPSAPAPDAGMRENYVLQTSLPENNDDSTSWTNDLLPPPTPLALHIVDVPENAVVLNGILHAVYSLALPVQPEIAWHELAAVVDTMLGRYGFSLRPSSPLFPFLLAHAAIRPLEVFSLAAAYDAADLAVAASQYLLSVSPTLAEGSARRIGAHYLSRLIALLYGRVETLRKVVADPLQLHHPAPSDVACSNGKQAVLRADWNIGVAQLIADARYVQYGTALQSHLT